MHSINWSGVRSWLPAPESGERVLATILFTDIVGSTELAARLGDGDWRELVGRHNREVRGALDRYRGREVAVHEAARVASAASGGEILVSSTTYQLASGAGLTFEDRGPRELKGLSGPRSLYAVTAG